jgi:hypothetical protein
MDTRVPHLHPRRLTETHPMRYTPMRCTPMRCTPMRCTPVRCTPMRHTSMRYTPMRYTPIRYTPVRCTPMSLFFFPHHLWELRARLPLMYTLCPATVQEIRKMAHNTGGDYVVQIIPNQYITGSVLDGYINARKSEFGEAWTREVRSYSGVISGEN